MDGAKRSQQLTAALRALGFERDRAHTEKLSYRGEFEVAGAKVNVTLLFFDTSLTRLPKLKINDPARDAPNVVAHLEPGDFLCYASEDQAVLDPLDVSGSAALCVELAKRAVIRALQTKYLSEEIASEFPQHWHGRGFYYDLSTGGQAQLYIDHADARSYLFLVDGGTRRRWPEPPLDRFKDTTSAVIPAYVFVTTNRLDFVGAERRPEVLEEFLDWAKRVAGIGPDAILSRICDRYPKVASVFVKGENGCVGIAIQENELMVRSAQRKPGLQSLLRSGASRVPVTRLAGASIDPAFVYNRNVRDVDLGAKRIAVLGCGTIGGFAAKFLAQSGAGQNGGLLLLLDNQDFAPGNIGRHALGVPEIGRPKADSVRDVLKTEHPTGSFLAVQTDAVTYLKSLDSFDLIVDATGDEAVSNYVNYHFVSRRMSATTPAVMHIWLFGNGAAAQAVLVDDHRYGCYKCLRPEHGGQWRYNPLAEGVSTTVTEAACGEGRYVRFGVAASVSAAALVVQMALDWTAGDPSPRLRTTRIVKAETIERRDKNPPKSDHCEVCRRETG